MFKRIDNLEKVKDAELVKRAENLNGITRAANELYQTLQEKRDTLQDSLIGLAKTGKIEDVFGELERIRRATVETASAILAAYSMKCELVEELRQYRARHNCDIVQRYNNERQRIESGLSEVTKFARIDWKSHPKLQEIKRREIYHDFEMSQDDGEFCKQGEKLLATLI